MTPTAAEKRRAIAMFAVMMVVALAMTALVSAGLGAILTLGWNAAIAGPLDAPRITFWMGWPIAAATGVVLAGLRIAIQERARRRAMPGSL